MRYTFPELTNWQPVNRLSSLRDQIDRLFDLSLPTWEREAGFLGGWSPALDMSQDKDNVFVKIELPGFKKEEIDISLHDGTLSISGERKHDEEKKEGDTFRSERFFGRFHRSVSLPVSVDGNSVKAAYKDGVLTVTLPKKEEAKPKQIEVSVS